MIKQLLLHPLKAAQQLLRSAATIQLSKLKSFKVLAVEDERNLFQKLLIIKQLLLCPMTAAQLLLCWAATIQTLKVYTIEIPN